MAQSPSNLSLTITLCIIIWPLVILCTAVDNSTRKSHDNNPLPLCYGGQPGTNGIPGVNGIPGSPGASGRDGRDGFKGEQGSPGKTGPQGPPGDGGIKGEVGIQGPVGQKGERGEKGESGTLSGAAHLSSHMNWKECAWKKTDDKDIGEIYSCQFIKNFTETALHVYFAGNLRIEKCDLCCSRWYFTFNGVECTSPGPIEGAFYLEKGDHHNLHRHRHIEGHCSNVHKGNVRVGFWVGSCASGYYKLANAYTGWVTVSRIFIEEVAGAQQ